MPWLWLGFSGAGAVAVAGAGVCGCIFGAFSCGCRADGWGTVVHAFMVSHMAVACSAAWLLVYAHAPNDDDP